MKEKIKLTIFTPVYNRADMIGNLYESLVSQTCKKQFEWIIVDDGSTDNLDKTVSCFIKNSTFPIRYIKQKNGGKHRAINKGVCNAKGKLFFIVDSDDCLKPNAIEFIYSEYEKIKTDSSFAGFAGLRVYPNGQAIVSNSFNKSLIDCSILDFRYKKRIKGDLAEVFYTEVLRRFPFPDLADEHFCAESLVWNRIGEKYQFRFIYQPIYICDYLIGGLSDNSLKLRVSSPNYARLNAFELSHYEISLIERIKACINFWRFTYHANRKKKINFKPSLWCFLFFPFGWLLFVLDRFKLRKNS